MSQFLPEPTQATTNSPIFSSSDAPAADADVALMQRVFATAASHPSLIPDAFTAYLFDWIQTQRLEIPIGQVFGFSQQTPNISTVNTSEHTASSTYGDLSTVGPEIDGIAAGQYVVLWGASVMNTDPGCDALLAPDWNAAGASDGDAADWNNISSVAVTPGVGQISIARATLKTLPNPSNSIALRYRQANGGTAYFRFRWLVAIKYANL